MEANVGTGDAVTLEQLADRWRTGWEQHDVEALAALCSEDVVWDEPALPETIQGREEVRQFLTATFEAFPDLRCEVGPAHISQGKATLVIPYRFTGTMKRAWRPLGIAATGARVDFEAIDRLEVLDGLVARYDTYYDSLGVVRQIGALPALGSSADQLMRRMQHVQAAGQRLRKRLRPG